MTDSGGPSPLSRGERSARWYEIAEALRSRPGEWANCGVFTPGTASWLARGDQAAFVPNRHMSREEKRRYMAEHWEVRTRNVEPNSKLVRIYIRWIGDAS